jgi:hypothetical protein
VCKVGCLGKVDMQQCDIVFCMPADVVGEGEGVLDSIGQQILGSSDVDPNRVVLAKTF